MRKFGTVRGWAAVLTLGMAACGGVETNEVDENEVQQLVQSLHETEGQRRFTSKGDFDRVQIATNDAGETAVLALRHLPGSTAFDKLIVAKMGADRRQQWRIYSGLRGNFTRASISFDSDRNVVVAATSDQKITLGDRTIEGTFIATLGRDGTVRRVVKPREREPLLMKTVGTDVLLYSWDTTPEAGSECVLERRRADGTVRWSQPTPLSDCSLDAGWAVGPQGQVALWHWGIDSYSFKLFDSSGNPIPTQIKLPPAISIHDNHSPVQTGVSFGAGHFLSSGDLLLATNQYEEDGYYRGAYLVRLNAQGRQQSTRSLGNRLSPNRATFSKDGSLLASYTASGPVTIGNEEITASDKRMVLAQFRQTGALVSWKVLSSSDLAYVSDLATTGGGHLMVAGSFKGTLETGRTRPLTSSSTERLDGFLLRIDL